ncbi:MAG TPA: hypothetical protein EYP55_06320 [Anaerolineae bacterium]|nr:hypothetical protein [Anaerolineae bacterium]
MRQEAQAQMADGRRVGVLVADEDVVAFADLGLVVEAVGSAEDLSTVARRLFGALRALDARGVEIILARDFGSHGLGLAIRDRLRRAASSVEEIPH